MKRVSIIIPIIIVAAIVITGVFYVYQKYFNSKPLITSISDKNLNSQATKWTTCTESTYFKYQFKYPEGWEIGILGGYGMPIEKENASSCEGASVGVSVSSLQGDNFFSIKPYRLDETIYNDRVKNIDDYISVIMPDEEKTNSVNYTITGKGNVGGEQAIFFNSGNGVDVIVVIHMGIVYDIWFSGSLDNKIKSEILDSFTFLK